MVREMSAAELEARCRKCVRVEASDVGALVRVLDGMGVEYSVADDTHADVYTDVPVTELVLAAQRENCAIRSMSERDESLESFYMDLMGGARHE